MNKVLCLNCEHLEQEQREIYVDTHGYVKPWMTGEQLYWYCHYKLRYFVTVPKRCKHHSPFTQTRLKIGVDGYMKIDQVPSEGARLDLSKLPPEIDLIALEEKEVAEADGKSGGLKITFKTANDERVTQKYTPISGALLASACKKLGIKDTTELQDKYYHYVLTQMRMGFPRYIPTKKTEAKQ